MTVCFSFYLDVTDLHILIFVCLFLMQICDIYFLKYGKIVKPIDKMSVICYFIMIKQVKIKKKSKKKNKKKTSRVKIAIYPGLIIRFKFLTYFDSFERAE